MTERRTEPTPRRLLLLLLICLLGFGLRLYNLDGQSMWSDEGLSFYRAAQHTADVLANTITVDGVPTVDTNPPFYFLLLHGWRALLGESVFKLRLMGVYAATLAVPLMYVLGRVLSGPRAGLLAALLMAVSPFHVWQAQVLRNYSLLITLNLFSVYGLARLLHSPPRGRRAWLALWLGGGLLGIYTHYFGFFVFAFTLAAFTVDLLLSRRVHGAIRRRTVYALVLLAGLLLPAVLAAFTRFRAGRQFDFFAVDPWGVALQAASAFSVGMSPTLTHSWPLLIPALLLFAGGIALGWRQRRGATLFLLSYQIVPLGLLLALSAINPLFNGTRHLLIGLPPFLLLCAALPAALWRRHRAWSSLARMALLLAFLAISVQVVWLQRQFNHTDFVRDDVRAAAMYLNEMATAEDIVVLHDTLIKFTFDAYYQGPAPVIAAPLFARQSEEDAIARLQNAAAGSRRVSFLTHPQPRTGFPRDALLRWANSHWHRLNTIQFEWLWLPVRLQAYSVQPESAGLPSAATVQEASYENGLTMHGFEMPRTLKSGAPFAVSFYLSRELLPAQANADANYEISLRFLDDQGRLWRQIDQSLWPDYPLREWPPAALLRYEHITRLPVGLPPGDYQVWMRVVNREADRNLLLAGGGVDVYLANVAVSAAPCRQVSDPWPTYIQDDTFFGSSLLLEGHSEPAAHYRPGHLLSVDLLWCVLRAPEARVRVQARLTDAQGAVVAHVEETLTRADFAPDAWQSNQLLQGKIELVLPAAMSAGVYNLQLAVVRGEPGATLPVNLGFAGRTATIDQITVEEWPIETTFPPIASPLRADFGDPVLFELHGYALEDDTLAPGESTTLTFYWRAAMDAPAVNYFAFVHVVEEGEPPVAQADGPPLQGFRPTSSWRAGAVFVDERTLAIPPDAPAGDYHLTVGFYDPVTNLRLPAFIAGQRQEQDVVVLQPVTVSP